MAQVSICMQAQRITLILQAATSTALAQFAMSIPQGKLFFGSNRSSPVKPFVLHWQQPTHTQFRGSASNTFCGHFMLTWKYRLWPLVDDAVSCAP